MFNMSIHHNRDKSSEDRKYEREYQRELKEMKQKIKDDIREIISQNIVMKNKKYHNII